MELDREQIIKAFECCSLNACACTSGCPYRGTSGDWIGEECWRKARNDLYILIKELTEENKKIGIENFDLVCELSRIREDTVRKMQERLKANKICRDGLSFKVVDFDTIDQIAKEMLEGG